MGGGGYYVITMSRWLDVLCQHRHTTENSNRRQAKADAIAVTFL